MPEHYIAFWNVENLFDVENAPNRSEKLQKQLAGELEGWTEDVLKEKVSRLAEVISALNGGRGPDVLGVCEIENRSVLDRLVEGLAPLGRRYGVAHADTRDKRGIDVAFIYDRGLYKRDAFFQHFILRRAATRDIVQVNLVSKETGRDVPARREIRERTLPDPGRRDAGLLPPEDPRGEGRRGRCRHHGRLQRRAVRPLADRLRAEHD